MPGFLCPSHSHILQVPFIYALITSCQSQLPLVSYVQVHLEMHKEKIYPLNTCPNAPSQCASNQVHSLNHIQASQFSVWCVLTDKVSCDNLLYLVKFPPSFSWSVQPVQATTICSVPCLCTRLSGMSVVCLVDGPRHPKLTHLGINLMSCFSALTSNHQGGRALEVPEAYQG